MVIISSLKRIYWKKYLCAAVGITALYGILSACFESLYSDGSPSMHLENSLNSCQLVPLSDESWKFSQENSGIFALGYNGSSELVTRLLHNLMVKKRFDAKRNYAIQDFAITGESWEDRGKWNQVAPCLATQGSLLYLHHIPFLVKQWQALVSVVVFVPEADFHLAVLHIENMRKCYPEVRSNVTFHFVYPLMYPATVSDEDLDFDVEDCSIWNLNLTEYEHFNSSKILYPQNVLRNVARKSCATDYILLADIDMIPSRGLAPELETFLASKNVTKCKKCVYVVAAYETSENGTVPNNKSELLDLVNRKLARPYRKKAFHYNQAATNSSVWEKLPSGNRISVGYRLDCFEFYYEPFYVAQDSVPPHDERFLGYGFTRNTQVYETQLAGYRFFVLDNAFLIQHKMVDSAFSSPIRTSQVDMNAIIYQGLKKEFSVKYKKLEDLPCNKTIDTN